MHTEDMFDTIINSSVFGVFIYKPEDGIIVFANTRAEEMLCYNPGELIGKPLFDLLPEGEEKEQMKENVKRRSKGEKFSSEYIERYLKSKSGALIPTTAFAYTILYDNKLSAIVLLIDKTKEKAYEKLSFALRQINQLIITTEDEQDLLEQSANLLVYKVGYGACAIGYIDDQLLFRQLYTKAHTKEHENALRSLTISANPNTPYGKGTVGRAYHTKNVTLIDNVLKSDTFSYWHKYHAKYNINSVTSIPIIRKDKVEYVIFILDSVPHSFDKSYIHLIEELKKNLSFALEKIDSKKELSFFKKASESSHEWVVITDKDGTIIGANKAVSDISGYALDEIIGKTPRIFKSGYHKSSFYEKLWQKLLSGQACHYKLKNKAKDGSIFYLDSIIVPVTYNNQLYRLVNLGRDITREVHQLSKIENLSNMYAILAAINQAIIKYNTKEELFSDILNVIVENELFDSAWFAMLSNLISDDTLTLSDNDNYLPCIRVYPKGTYANYSKKCPLASECKSCIIYKKTILKGKIFINNSTKSSKAFDQYTKEFLIKYNYNSSAAIPVVENNKVIGVLHLYSQKEHFFNKEIYELLKQVQFNIAFALEQINYRKLLEQITNFKELLSDLNYLIAHTDSQDKLMQDFCDLVIKHTHLALVWIGKPNQEGYLEFLAASGKTDYLKDNKISVNPNMKESQGTSGQAWRLGEPFYTDSIQNAPYMQPWHKLAKQFGLNASATFPVFRKQKIWGLVNFYHDKEYAFNNSQLKDILNTIVSTLSYGLEKLEDQKWQAITQSALNSGFDLVVITDKDFNIEYVNDNTLRVSGYTKEELIGKHHSIFSSGRNSKEFAKRFYETLVKGGTYTGIMTYKLKDGSLKDFYTTIVPNIEKNTITHYIGITREIGKDKKLLEELKKAIYHDSLTGLYNAYAFLERVDRFLERAKQESHLGALVIINPISFVNINNALGFEAGNELLVQIAQRLKQNVSAHDVIAKLESDRFGILLNDFKYEEDVLISTTRILFELSKPYTIKGQSVSLPFNIGLSLFPKDAQSPQKLINEAHVALKDAKNKGENQIGFFKKDIEDQASNILRLRAELDLAIIDRQFIAYYQPYVDVNQEISGAEALIRWQKDSKIIPPMEFIPLLERTDLIIKAEEQLIDKVLRFMQTNKLSIPISINLSANSLKQRNLFESILSNLRYYNIDPSLIKLELLERIFIDDKGGLKNLIKRFKEAGISFSIDDFGTGYSSLSHLANLNIDNLKIDISFVRNIHLKSTQSVVKSIIFIAKELNMKTVAEGVETKEQFSTLLDFGCDYFQGYLFFKPMPEEDFKGLINSL